ncbi:MAG: 4-(cytidine 5'-diphospho)-2-C-methyl-D-erythritol kinase [Clostridia bacterium]|nr:4-(cytidine 5'-diphospho)-2-C-methyl-D-erythritol kinase [Clostridia bacterium]
MKELQIKCPVKINLSLDVVNRREDGYHNLKMIMQEIKLYDILTFSIDEDCRQTQIILEADSTELPLDESNLIYKAAKLFFHKTEISASARIHLRKNIPMGAGLGGGSTDAAGTLLALNKVFGEPLTIARLAQMAKALGADVPFFLHGGCMLAEGIGEILTPIPPLKNVYIVLAKPPVHISTPWVYKNLVLNENTAHPDTNSVIEALKTNNLRLLSQSAGNVLESVTAREYPQIEEYKAVMKSHGASYSLMSGSGSSVFGIFSHETEALSALEEFKKITSCAYIV